ncbi:hypothetical protein FA95DRAFT_1614238 [Auriscalpium vulgare]|uniref:Uncharacterized protein n=1 Tax=Auriscalpium vulgare TaxID=40419 RepID=A0ACB8R0U8_9AGAM|nr:hypothetical protein FA95DRAFT_1614238 [Auriscalpium vulgare]
MFVPDTPGDALRGKPSPLFQQRMQNAAAKKGDAAPAININLPPEAFTFARQLHAPPGEVQPTLPSAATTTDQSIMLLPRGVAPGQQMSIEDFCSVFDLSDTVCKLLVENEFSGSHTFRHITIADLKDMGFKLGAIAAFKDAVLTWAGAVNKV